MGFPHVYFHVCCNPLTSLPDTPDQKFFILSFWATCFSAQGLFLVALRKPYSEQGNKPRTSACKINDISSVLYSYLNNEKLGQSLEYSGLKATA